MPCMALLTIFLCYCRVTSKDVTVRLDGQDIDLWQVYSAVLELGGSYKVNQHSLWEEVYTKVFRSV